VSSLGVSILGKAGSRAAGCVVSAGRDHTEFDRGECAPSGLLQRRGVDFRVQCSSRQFDIAAKNP